MTFILLYRESNNQVFVRVFGEKKVGEFDYLCITTHPHMAAKEEINIRTNRSDDREK